MRFWFQVKQPLPTIAPLSQLNSQRKQSKTNQSDITRENGDYNKQQYKGKMHGYSETVFWGLKKGSGAIFH